jgi:hypothetical protein
MVLAMAVIVVVVLVESSQPVQAMSEIERLLGSSLAAGIDLSLLQVNHASL